MGKEKIQNFELPKQTQNSVLSGPPNPPRGDNLKSFNILT